MAVTSRVLEVVDGKEVSQICLTNDNGVVASLLTLGATWQEFLVPDGQGGLKNLVLGFDLPSDYNRNGLCAGQSIGRVAGRIRDGQISLDGQDFQLAQNNNDNCLHGGPKGFHKQHWDFELDQADNAVTFTYAVKEAEDGFPGDFLAKAKYRLTEEDQLEVTYSASQVTAKTLFNPTNHVYFNLSQGQDLTSHQIRISAEAVLETREDLIPTGVKKAVAGTAYDCRQPVNLGQVIEATGGLDDAFVVAAQPGQPIAQLSDQESGDRISVYSDRNALVVYTMNSLEEGVAFARDQGLPGRAFEGVALETQTLPDAIHHPDFGDITLSAGQEISHTIRFAYDKI